MVTDDRPSILNGNQPWIPVANPIAPSFYFQPIIFNHWIAEKSVRSFVKRLASRLLIGARGEINLQVFSDMHSSNLFVPHVFKSVLHRFALRIKHSFFGGNDDFCFHVARQESPLLPGNDKRN